MTDRLIRVLEQLLRYEPETGKLFWRQRSAEFFPDQRACNSWNVKNAGKEAFTATKSGYKVGALFSKIYRAHRIVWALHYGQWPEVQIDHVNGDRADNRLSNLRDVCHQDNGKNQRLRSTNTSGATGIGYVARLSKWRAQITDSGARLHLGVFPTFDEALAVRRAWEAKLNYHPNHGRVCND
jgi:hypothetical protein